MKVLREKFPFHKILNQSGEFFDSPDELSSLGFRDDQVWALFVDSKHCVFVPIQQAFGDGFYGFFATEESHDGITLFLNEN